MNIYGFEKGKETEKAVKEFLGLPVEVAGAGKIDAFYAGYSIEIKRGACALYVGKRFNRYRNASNAIGKLVNSAFLYEGTNEGSALERSEKVAYSIDGTVKNTHIMSMHWFLSVAESTGAVRLSKQSKGIKMLRIVPNKIFREAVASRITLADWKARQDEKGEGLEALPIRPRPHNSKKGRTTQCIA